MSSVRVPNRDGRWVSNLGLRSRKSGFTVHLFPHLCPHVGQPRARHAGNSSVRLGVWRGHASGPDNGCGLWQQQVGTKMVC